MTPERYDELMKSDSLQLNKAEVAEGWRFCMCEWDGLLIKAGDPEAQVCSCFFEQEGKVCKPSCPECENVTPSEELKDNEGLCKPCRMARDERLKEAGRG